LDKEFEAKIEKLKIDSAEKEEEIVNKIINRILG
jgi:hypothetical protein